MKLKHFCGFALKTDQIYEHFTVSLICHQLHTGLLHAFYCLSALGTAVLVCYRLQATNSSARSLVSIEQSQGFQTVLCLIGC